MQQSLALRTSATAARKAWASRLVTPDLRLREADVENIRLVEAAVDVRQIVVDIRWFDDIRDWLSHHIESDLESALSKDVEELPKQMQR